MPSSMRARRWRVPFVLGLLLGMLASCAPVAEPVVPRGPAAHNQELGGLSFLLPKARPWQQIPISGGPIGMPSGQTGRIAIFATQPDPGHTLFVRTRTITAPAGGFAGFRDDPRVTAVQVIRPEQGRRPHSAAPASRIGPCLRTDLGGEDRQLRDAARRPFVYRVAMLACESAARTLLVTAELSERGPRDSLGPLAGFTTEAEGVFAGLSVAP